MRLGKVTIIGVGLLGGSIGLRLRKKKLADSVHGFVRRKAAARTSVKAGAVSTAGLNLREAVANADLVILCTPIAVMQALVEQMLPHLKRGAIVTDVGSVKAPLVRAFGPRLREAGVHYVGSHPMAGSEKDGMRAARPDLFDKAVCVVTPDSKTSRAALRKVEALWRSLGCRILIMEPTTHDRMVARTSHLPHLLACALANQVLDPRQDKRQTKLCATGFRDTTRVAAGSPEMWRDIALANRKNLARDLARFEATLTRLRCWLTKGDAEKLEDFFVEARQLRGCWDHARASFAQE